MQRRAKNTVRKILDATAELLDEEGFENLTTDRVAERSEVNIATLYHYFPNKLALLYALAQELADKQEEQLEAIYGRHEELDWRVIVDMAADKMLEFHLTTKGATAVSRAMQQHASLREIDREQDLRGSRMVAALLEGLGIKGSPSELQTIALVLLQAATAVMDNALRWYPENAQAAIDEVKTMHRQYIEYYLRKSGADA